MARGYHACCINKQWLMNPYCYIQVVTLSYLSFIIALGIPASLTSTLCGLLQWELTLYILLLTMNLLHNLLYNIIITLLLFVIVWDFICNLQLVIGRFIFLFHVEQNKNENRDGFIQNIIKDLHLNITRIFQA